MTVRRFAAVKPALHPRGDLSYKRIGTAYEHYACKALSALGIDADIYGSTGDGGVDLVGKWHLTPAVLHDIRVVVQCKRLTSKPCPPNFVRELEGVYHTFAQSTVAEGTKSVAMMVSKTTASKQAMERMRSSVVPIAFLRLVDSHVDGGGLSEDTSSSPADVSEQILCQMAIERNGGLVQVALNAALQSLLPDLSVVSRRHRIGGLIWNLPTLVHAGHVISRQLSHTCESSATE